MLKINEENPDYGGIDSNVEFGQVGNEAL
ncbi:hypothetical protein PITCH_A1150006 [uncultured Desulfobacterium sp.]|uniref:Uncharacterized protein n=1 Tax=uncultured Desulfobacterium sp. TaxID=201089 RepID=A0A445MR78_9BACT|nr:hypothetical protein PITCH_A1150006 [uncultured Desulfobacterium sp.]